MNHEGSKGLPTEFIITLKKIRKMSMFTKNPDRTELMPAMIGTFIVLGNDWYIYRFSQLTTCTWYMLTLPLPISRTVQLSLFKFTLLSQNIMWGFGGVYSWVSSSQFMKRVWFNLHYLVIATQYRSRGWARFEEDREAPSNRFGAVSCCWSPGILSQV